MSPTSLPRAVIFDWDNTLVDSWDAIAAAMNETLVEFGKKPWTLEEVKEGCKLAAKDYFPALFGAAWESARDAYYRHFAALRSVYGTRERKGSEILLAWLQKKNIPAFVVSNKRGDALREECASLGWAAYFVSLIGAGDATNDKPSRAPVDLALENTSFAAGPMIWFVGDTDVDMQCARASGCTPILVGSKKAGEALQVDLSFEDCSTLQLYLETMPEQSAA